MKWLGLILALIVSPAFAQNSPPVGNQFPIQPAKTTDYTIKNTDLKSTIPMNCSSPCVVTFPASTSTFPKGYPVEIVNIGSAQVSLTPVAPSIFYGVPLTSGNVLMTAVGQFAYVTADSSNNFFVNGVVAPQQTTIVSGGTDLLTIGTDIMTE